MVNDKKLISYMVTYVEDITFCIENQYDVLKQREKCIIGSKAFIF